MLKKLSVLLPVLLCVFAAAASAASVRVKTDKTPMRATASAAGAVVMELKAGMVLELVDVNRDWYKVRDPQSKKEGFVAVAVVELLPGPATPAAGQKPGSPGQKPTAKPGAKPPAPPKKSDWLDTGYLSINGIYEGGTSAFTQKQAWLSFAETATVTVDYPAKNAPGFGFDAGFRVWKNLAVGLGVTYVTRSTTTGVTGTLPNPLYLNRPITLSGDFNANNTEMGLHLQAAWVVPMPPKMQLVLFAGPSIFSVKQTIVQVQGIGLSAYPFESGSISSAATTDASKTAIGFGAGADVEYFFTRTIGVGGIVRFTRASVSFPVEGQTAVDVNAGGFQAGVGLRVRIPSARSPKPAPKPPAPKTLPKPKSEPIKKK
jgi:hypothetical protein